MGYLFVFLGSGIGGFCRYILSKFIYNVANTDFPLGTFVVNLLGCYFIGLLTSVFENLIITPEIRLFIFTGFLGGFTTFSTFQLENFLLMKSNQMDITIWNILLSNIIGILLLIAGYLTYKTIAFFLK